MEGPTPPKPTCTVSARLQYFEKLFAASSLEVRDDGAKGVGVYVKKAFSEGDVLFGEEPDATVKWRQSPLACEHCMKALGSMEFQMHHLHKDSASPLDLGIEQLPDMSPAEAKLSEVRSGWSPFREASAWFCSEDCELAEEKAFAVLKKQQEAVRAFVQHAFRAGVPFFLLALKVMIRATGLVDHLLQRPYWECIDVPEEGNANSFLEEIKTDLAESWELLRKLDFPGKPGTLEAYSHFVGCLCLNVIAVKYANPLIYYIQEVDQGRGGAEAKQKLRPILEAIEKRQDEAPEDIDSESDLEDDELTFSWPSASGKGEKFEFSSSLFPPIKGYGLFPCLSACNHSCDPSAEVLFAGSTKLLLIARRALQVGQEVCISYIDHEEADTEKRQAALRSYGFRCDCHRCRPKSVAKRKKGARKAGSKGPEPPRKVSKGK